MSDYVKCVSVVPFYKGSKLYDVELVARNGVVLSDGSQLFSRDTSMKRAEGLAHQLGVPVVQKYVKEEVPE